MSYIEINSDTKKRLDERKSHPDESYDDVIQKLLRNAYKPSPANEAVKAANEDPRSRLFE